MTTCPHCGREISEDTKFCPYCGEPQHPAPDLDFVPDKTQSSPTTPLPSTGSLEATYTEHLGKLGARQVALYVEALHVPLIIDVNERATLGRRSMRGSAPGPSISLNAFDAFGKGVSRVHVTLFYAEGQLMVVDEYATNGTWLNGKRLEPMIAAALHNGDELMLARLHIRVYLPDGATN